MLAAILNKELTGKEMRASVLQMKKKDFKIAPAENSIKKIVAFLHVDRIKTGLNMVLGVCGPN